jgi:hypothetical protein
MFQEVSPATIDALHEAMDRSGYGVLRQCLPREFLEQAAQFVNRELIKTGGEYFSYIGSDQMAGSPLEELGCSPAFRGFLAGIYERTMGCAAPEDEFLQVLRVVSGVTGLKHSHRFHYDAYVVTALVPIIIPTGPDEVRGDLVMYPNVRSVRSSVAVNLFEKVLLQNFAIAPLLARPFVQRQFGAKVIRMEPGNIYVFWGYRSLHANRPCPPDRVRSTALFHLANPHSNNVMIRGIEERHRKKSPWLRGTHPKASAEMRG